MAQTLSNRLAAQPDTSDAPGGRPKDGQLSKNGDLKAMELAKAMELKAMELAKAMELKAMELGKAMELSKAASLGAQELSKITLIEGQLRAKLSGADKELVDSIQASRQKVEALLRTIESGLDALSVSMIDQNAKNSDSGRTVHIHLHLP